MLSWKSPHPGELLRRKYLLPLGLSTESLASQMGMPSADLDDMFAGRRRLTVHVAEQLSRRLGTSPSVWINMQESRDW